MSASKNCWEVMQCGREPGGAQAGELGVCPAATDTSSDGLNGGKNGGRICWAISGTLCGAEKQGTYAQKRTCCLLCDFYELVKNQQGLKTLALLKPGQKYKASED